MTSRAGIPIFASSFLMALGGALLLAIASLVVIFNTPVPFAMPVSTLDVARALRGQTHANFDTPLVLSIGDEPAHGVLRGDAVNRALIHSLARQAGVAETEVFLSFDAGPGDPAQRQFDMARRKYEAGLIEFAALYRDEDRFSPLIFGSFRAGLRQESGKWLIATRRPPPPRWQYNIIKGLLLSLLLMLPFAWWFSRRIANPLRRLAEAANAVGGGNYPDIPLDGPREVRQVGNAMNQMQQRIRQQIDERSEMLAAIAHDLRTPLSRLAFLLAGQPLEKRRKVDEELAEMERMIASTMDFVRAHSVPPMREPIDLRLLLESIVDDFADRGEPVRLSDGPRTEIQGDAGMLRRVFENVVANALTYGRDASVSLNHVGTSAVVEIRDLGPGMTEGDMAQAFEPFFRADRSRNSATGGMGLGLAIARRGVQAHGGQIQMRNAEPCGLVVSISLPL